MAAVDEGFAQVELAACDQVFGETLQHLFEHARRVPHLEAAKTRCVRWVTTRHVGPRCACAKHPENTVENIARVTPRSSASVFANLRNRKHRFNNRPLLIVQVHHDLRSEVPRAVDRRRIPLNARTAAS